jgi:hypothetical protein
MAEIAVQIRWFVVLAVIVIFCLSWKLFSKIGNKVFKVKNQIKDEIDKGDK